MKNKLRYQFSRFLIGGMVSVNIDWFAYFLVNQYSDLGSTFSKATGFLLGTIFAFYYNGTVTFHSKLGKPEFLRHVILYILSMTINVTVFNFAMKTGHTIFGSTSILSLALATSISMILNFLGMRNWVFRRKLLSHD